ncbi:hypothetical protein U5B43_09825 [Campylobacter sp. 9BO]|uniref:NACHT domain-containing protein n=1 Tax=Campylobacter sp. 9BO TaxID=3424759 RepID=UPI003D33201A
MFEIEAAPYKNNTNFIDTQKLIKLFEDHYPEFFFNDSIETFLSERMKKIEQFLGDNNNDEYFIQPNIKKITRSRQELIISDNDKNTLNRIGEQIFGKKETLDSFLKILMSKTKKKFLLTGDAGSGKSILVFKMVLVSINYFLKENLKCIPSGENRIFLLPVCFKATDFIDKHSLDDFYNAINFFYGDMITLKPNLIIIDGIDEVGNEARNNIKENIEKYLLESENNANILFTSRINYGIIESLFEYENYELLPYGVNQAIALIKKIIKNNNMSITAIEKSINELEGQIPFYPLALKLLMDVVKEKHEVPASITELYNRYVSLIFGEYKTTDIDIDRLFEPKIKKDFLSSLAYQYFFQRDKIIISNNDFQECIDLFCNKYNFITKSDFIDSINRTSLIKIDEQNNISFSHKSFLDYFIALYFKENKEELGDSDQFDILFDLYTSDGLWEDVAYFYFGLKTKINQKDLEKLNIRIEKIEDRFEKNINIMFLGKLLQYGWMTESSIKSKVIEKAIDHSLNLKDDFNSAFQKILKISNPPKIISSIAMLHLTRMYYSSMFIVNEVKSIISEVASYPSSLDGIDLQLNENKLYFCTIYILSNIDLLGKEYVGEVLLKFLPKINSMSNIENNLLLTVIIDIFKNKNKLNNKEDLNLYIKKIVNRQKRKYPELIKSIFSAKKKKDFKKLPSYKRKRLN